MGMERSLQTQVVRFGDFALDLRAGELLNCGSRMRLQEQPFRVLSTLLRYSPEVVLRQELQREIWPEKTFVDFEHGLNKVINKLRDVLCDSASNPRFIETVARRGYRFIAPITPCLPTGSNDAKVRVAILPFQNLSDDAERDYFCDGLTGETICCLGQMGNEHLGVIARTCVLSYKGTQKSVEQIGRELQVDYLLESSVRSSSGRVRVTAQLICCTDQTHRWAQTYELQLTDVFETQACLAKQICEAVSRTLRQRRTDPPV
jgi:TolB-like protein